MPHIWWHSTRSSHIYKMPGISFPWPDKWRQSDSLLPRHLLFTPNGIGSIFGCLLALLMYQRCCVYFSWHGQVYHTAWSIFDHCLPQLWEVWFVIKECFTFMVPLHHMSCTLPLPMVHFSWYFISLPTSLPLPLPTSVNILPSPLFLCFSTLAPVLWWLLPSSRRYGQFSRSAQESSGKSLLVSQSDSVNKSCSHLDHIAPAAFYRRCYINIHLGKYILSWKSHNTK